MTTSHTQATTAVDQLAGSVTELRFPLQHAIPPPNKAVDAFRALITAVRELRNQRDEYPATTESLKAELAELYRLVDALSPVDDGWPSRSYGKQVAP
jgi:hypothetical protein